MIGPPRYRTTFVGRSHTARRVERLLSSPGSLVTLVGPGGVGKTRLAAEVAGPTALFVDLGGAHDPDAVIALVLGACGASSPGLAAPADEAVRAVRNTRVPTVVLDGAELVVDGVRALLEAWFSADPPARVLVTSRVPVGVAGEHVEPVEPLPLLGAGDPLDTSAAVQLLLDAVPPTGPELRFGANDAAAVARIVSACDGLPLGLQLAGARLAVLGVRALADALERGGPVLRDPTGGDAMAHSIARSFDAAGPVEQAVLLACSVFLGSFDFDGARAVCPELGEDALADALQALVVRSLVRVRAPTTEGRRFQLWDTVRAFAAARRTDGEGLRDRWRAHLVQVAARFASEAAGSGLTGALARADDQLADLLSGAAEPHPDAARICVSAYRLLLRRVSRARLTALFLAAAERAPEPALEIRLRVVASGDLLLLDRPAEAAACGARAWAVAQAHGTVDQRLAAAWSYGTTAWFTGARAEADAAMRAALAWEGGDPLVRARLWSNLAELALEDERADEASVALSQALAAEPLVADPVARAGHTLRCAGLLARAGRPDEALAALDRFAAVPTMLPNDRSVAAFYAAASHWLRGEAAASAAAWQRCATLSEGQPNHDASTVLYRGITRLGTDPEGARADAAEAATRWEQMALQTTRAMMGRLARMLAQVTGVPVGEAPLPPPSSYRFVVGAEALVAALLSGRADAATGLTEALALEARGSFEARLTAALVRAAATQAHRRERTWVVDGAGTWFRPPEGAEVSLASRAVLVRILAALAAEPAGLTTDAVFAAGWPGERVAEASRRNRVRVAISTLRKLGLHPLAFVDGVYRWDGPEPVRTA